MPCVNKQKTAQQISIQNLRNFKKHPTPDTPLSPPYFSFAFIQTKSNSKMETIKIIILSLSSLMLLFVGAMRLSNPIKTYLKNSGITLENDVNLLNEMRGISALMLLGGILTSLGIIIPSLTLTSFVIASMIFIGFAIGRCISLTVDGKPNKKIVQGILFELVLGAANIFGLINTWI